LLQDEVVQLMIADEATTEDDTAPCVRFRNKFNGATKLRYNVSQSAKACIQKTAQVWLVTENAHDVPKKNEKSLARE
jgi:hypothetical protein